MPSTYSRRRALAATPALAAAGFLATPGATADTRTPPRDTGTTHRAAVGTPFRTLRPGRAGEVGMRARRLREADEAVRAGLGEAAGAGFPGAVLLVARHGVVVKHTAYGHAQTFSGDTPLRRPMRTDTVFDLASVTKVAGTTAAVMRLVDAGRIRLADPISRWLPAFGTGGKRAITVRHLLTHTSGLWEWQPVYLHATNPRAAIRYVSGLPLRYRVGADRHYSDLNFMLLGEIVRRETGLGLPAFCRDQVHGPLGMTDTGYLPLRRHPRFRIAATSLGNAYERQMIRTGEPYPILGGATVDDYPRWPRHTLVGEVNDGNSNFAFQGVAGHAGLFGTAHDLAVYSQTLLNGGGYGRRRVFGADTVAAFTTERLPGQALGFWTDRFAEVPALGTGGFGHSGFTGTEFAVDEDRGLLVVLLTNRCHPDLPYASITDTWTGVCDAVGRSLS